MSILSIVKSIPLPSSRVLSTAATVAKKHAPTALIVGGVGSMLGGAILGAKNTLNLEDILAEHRETLDTIREHGESLPDGVYSDAARTQDLATVYTRIVIDIAKNYAIPAAMFTIGVAAVFGGHRMLLNRQAAAVAFGAATKKAFDRYRQKVVEKYGQDADREIINADRPKGKVRVVDGEKVEDITGLEGVESIDGSMYSRVFSSRTTNKWNRNPQYNQMFIRQVESQMNDLLNVRGHLFLNEVYDALGFPRTAEGAVVGWSQNAGNAMSSFVTFSRVWGENSLQEYLSDGELVYELDFNVDGVILNEI